MAKYKIGDKAATREGYGDALLELGKKHEEIIAMDADLAKSTKASVFAKAFPERFHYIGISEQDMVSTAAGLAMCGKVPFISTFSVFIINRALDQMRVSCAYSNANVKITGSHGGLMTGQDGPTGQGISDIATTMNIPNFQVFVPADYYETIAITNAMYENKGPMYMRTARASTTVLTDDVPEFKIGKANLLKEGADASIIAIGPMVDEAIKASEALKKQGISASVLNCASVKPLDEKAVLKEAQKGIVVTAEDGIVNGLGNAVASVMAENNTDAYLFRVGLNNSFAESGKPEALLKKYEMDADAIVKRVKKGLELRK